jgi:hypothetical protein
MSVTRFVMVGAVAGVVMTMTAGWLITAFGALLWSAIAGPVIATIATYVNLHVIVVAGLLLEWLLFALGATLACWVWRT